MMQSFVVLSTTRIWQLAAINLATLAFVLLGLVMFGLAPAVCACLWATARLADNTAGELVAGMWREYKREFVKANLVALPLGLAAAGLCAFAMLIGGMIGGVVLALASIAALQAIATMIAISHLSGGLRDAIANGTTAVAMAPYRLLASLVLVPIIVLATIWQPLVSFYFAVSAWAALTNALVTPALEAGFPNTASSEFNPKEVRS